MMITANPTRSQLWIEPTGKVHEFDDVTHGKWAMDKLGVAYHPELEEDADGFTKEIPEGWMDTFEVEQEAQSQLLKAGWIRMGFFRRGHAAVVYVQKDSPLTPAELGRAQTWIMQHPEWQGPAIDVQDPKLWTVPMADFLAAKKTTEFRGLKTAAGPIPLDTKLIDRVFRAIVSNIKGYWGNYDAPIGERELQIAFSLSATPTNVNGEERQGLNVKLVFEDAYLSKAVRGAEVYPGKWPTLVVYLSGKLTGQDITKRLEGLEGFDLRGILVHELAHVFDHIPDEALGVSPKDNAEAYYNLDTEVSAYATQLWHYIVTNADYYREGGADWLRKTGEKGLWSLVDSALTLRIGNGIRRYCNEANRRYILQVAYRAMQEVLESPESKAASLKIAQDAGITKADLQRIRPILREWVGGGWTDGPQLMRLLEKHKDILAKFRMSKPVRLWRNERAQILTRGGQDVTGPSNAGWEDQYTRPSAWSATRMHAESYASGNGRRLVTAIVPPEDTYCYIPLVEQAARALGMKTFDPHQQDEVIVRPNPSFLDQIRPKVTVGEEAQLRRDYELAMVEYHLPQLHELRKTNPKAISDEELKRRIADIAKHKEIHDVRDELAKLQRGKAARKNAGILEPGFSVEAACRPTLYRAMTASKVMYESALQRLYPALNRWVFYGNRSDKEQLLEAYAALSPRMREVWDAQVHSSFLSTFGPSVRVYRRMTEYGPVEPGSSYTTDPQDVPSGVDSRVIGPEDVLAHWGQSETPLASKRFGHEHEIILKPRTLTASAQAMNYQPKRVYDEDVLVTLDVAKVDASWRRDKTFYIEPGGGNQLRGRYDRFAQWLQDNQGTPIDPPDIGLTPSGEIIFGNGRHRFAVLRDQGAKRIAATVPRADLKVMIERFGAQPVQGTSITASGAVQALVGRAKQLTKQDPLSEALGPYECGAFDGGCLICAEALISAAGRGDLVRLVDVKGRTHHYGARIDGLYCDFSGAYPSGDMWAKTFARLEHVREALHAEEGLDPNYQEEETPRDPQCSREIAQLLLGGKTASADQQLLSQLTLEVEDDGPEAKIASAKLLTRVASSLPVKLKDVTIAEVLENENKANASGKHEGNPAHQYSAPEKRFNNTGPHVLINAPVRLLNHEHDAEDPDYMGTSDATKKRIDDYASRTTEAPPIYLTFSGYSAKRGGIKAFVSNGNHRVAAAVKAGRSTIKAYMPTEDFERWMTVLTTPKQVSARLLQRKDAQVVFHGSPYDFEAFKTDNIGSGEGEQMFGWGLYFTDTEAVARGYQESSRGKGQAPRIEDFPKQFQVPIYRALDRPNGSLRDSAIAGIREKLTPEYAALLDELAGLKGTLFEAEVPDGDVYLLWDAPQSQQPPVVKKLMGSTPSDYYTGGHWYNTNARRFGGAKALSLWLRSQGVLGVKYLDGNSRGKGNGTYNYVIFDDKDVRVTKKSAKLLLGSKTAKTFDQLYPATPEWVGAAKAFFLKKWQERAQERGMPLPVDVSNACKFGSRFAQKLFGGTLRGNWHHQFVQLPDGQRVDLGEDAMDRQTHGDDASWYAHDKTFWGNREHRESMASVEPRVTAWVTEFQKEHPVSRIAKTLYHGTSTERAQRIQREGLEPQVGDLTATAYEDDAESVGEELEPLTFAGDKDALQRGVYSAMLHAIQAEGHDITDAEQAIRNWGALVILRDGDEAMDYRHPDDGVNNPTEHPTQVEPGDYYSRDNVAIDYILTGPTLVRYLKRHGVNMERWTRPFSEQKRNALVGMVRRAHPDVPVEKILEKVDALTFEQFHKSWDYYVKLERVKTASNNEDAHGQCHCTVCGTEIIEGRVCTECAKTCRKCGGPTRNCKCASFVHAKDALCHDCWVESKTASADAVHFQEHAISAGESSFEGTKHPGVRVEMTMGHDTVGALEYYLDGDKAYVRGITVAPHYRGLGLGQQLYDEGIASARRHGATAFYSDQVNAMSPDAHKAWGRIRQRHPVTFESGEGGYDATGRHRIELKTAATQNRVWVLPTGEIVEVGEDQRFHHNMVALEHFPGGQEDAIAAGWFRAGTFAGNGYANGVRLTRQQLNALQAHFDHTGVREVVLDLYGGTRARGAVGIQDFMTATSEMDLRRELVNPATRIAALTKGDIQGRRRALEAFFPAELVQAAIDEAPDTYTMPKDEAVEEHERLIEVLRSPDHADDLQEADEQEGELRKIKTASVFYHGGGTEKLPPSAAGILWLTDDVHAAASHAMKYLHHGTPSLWKVTLKDDAKLVALWDLSDPIVRRVKEAVSEERRMTHGRGVSDEEWVRHAADFGALEAFPWMLKQLRASGVDGVWVHEQHAGRKRLSLGLINGDAQTSQEPQALHPDVEHAHA